MPENIGDINIIREVLDGKPVPGPVPAASFNPCSDLCVSVEATASPDELWQVWLELVPRVQSLADQMNDLATRWNQSTDPLVTHQLWADYESAARTYRVLASWKDVFYAAYVFATDGADCSGVELFPVPPAPPSGPPQT